MNTHRIAFYPCCATDIEQPLQLLADLVDEVVFCDNKQDLWHRWNCIVKSLEYDALPITSFVCKDVREAIEGIARIDILFYRKDSQGEGGSGVYILGQKMLPRILSKFPQEGGSIITDGSNSGHRIFKRMIRPSGYSPVGWGWHMQPANDQPYLNEHGLYTINVSPENR